MYLKKYIKKCTLNNILQINQTLQINNNNKIATKKACGEMDEGNKQNS